MLPIAIFFLQIGTSASPFERVLPCARGSFDGLESISLRHVPERGTG